MAKTSQMPRALIWDHDSGAFQLHFAYDAEVVADVRKIPHRKFVKTPSAVYWEASALASNARPLAELLKKHGFLLDEDAQKQLERIATLPIEERRLAPEIVGMPADGVLEVIEIRTRKYSPEVNSVIKEAAGAVWDRDAKCWRLPFSQGAHEVIGRLVNDFGITAEAGLNERCVAALAAIEQSIEMSSQAGIELDLVEPPGKSYRPFQRAGIRYIQAHHGRVLLADEMGLGKTIQAIGYINQEPGISKVLIVCPASLKDNWAREFNAWKTRNLSVAVVNGSDAASWPRDANVVVINYDRVAKHRQRIDDVEWDIMICDECHYMKNPKAARTIAVLGRAATKKEPAVPAIKAKRMLMLTGTPIENKPIELWPIISAINPRKFNNFFAFAKRYCGAHKTAYGWKFEGNTNLDELRTELRASCMVRRLKADVLKELPPKIRQIVPLDIPKAREAERTVIGALHREAEQLEAKRIIAFLKGSAKDFHEAARQLKDLQKIAFDRMAVVRRQIGMMKIPIVVEWVRNALEGGGKVLLFAHHQDVIEAYCREFGEEAVRIDGDVPPSERLAICDRFQKDAKIRVAVLSIKAAGMGLTLTAASTVIFGEGAWTPSALNQAEDRAHRIGQTDSVLVQHLVADGTLDARMAAFVVRKQEVIRAALDEAHTARGGEYTHWNSANNVEEEDDMSWTLPTFDSLSDADLAAWKERLNETQEQRDQRMMAERSARRDKRIADRAEDRAAERGLMDLAEKMTRAQIEAVHAGLKQLAKVCDGAVDKDSVGFNATDTMVGRALARQDEITALQAAYAREMLSKYIRQIGEELIAQMWASDAAEEECQVAQEECQSAPG